MWPWFVVGSINLKKIMKPSFAQPKNISEDQTSNPKKKIFEPGYYPCPFGVNRCVPGTFFYFRPSRASSTLSTFPKETLGMVVEVADMAVDMVAVTPSDFHSVSVSEP